MEVTAPEIGNSHATLGIEDKDFSDEDNYGLAFLNLAADGDPEVATKLYSINYDAFFKQSGGKVNTTWVRLDNQSTVNVLATPTWWLTSVKPDERCMCVAIPAK